MIDPDKVSIILGPPGCGKTTTLLGMVDDELRSGTPPDRIGYVSFTKKATEEARERAMERFKLKKTQLPWFRTIHSLCFAALGLSAGEVLEGKKLREFGEWVGIPVQARGYSQEEGSTFGFELGDRCLHMEALARARGVPLREQYALDNDDIPWNVMRRVTEGLVAYKRARHLVDFSDMLEMFAESEWTARLDVLFVDEGQDLSLLQWRVIQRIAAGTRRVVVAGDDDQAIYRWAGAAVEHFVGLPGHVRVLGQSYRVPEAVQGLALEALQGVQERRAKAWHPRVGAAGLVRRTGRLWGGVPTVPGEQALYLARNTCFLRDEVMPYLRSEGILYEFRGAPSVPLAVVEAVVDWERLRRGENLSTQEARGMYAQMEAGIGFQPEHRGLKSMPDEWQGGLADLRRDWGLLAPDQLWHAVLTRISQEDRRYMIRVLKRGGKLTRTPTVRVSTVHGAKGGEADHVILLTDMAKRTAREAERLRDDERRVQYVALTRARERLTIVAPQTNHGWKV